MKKAMATLIGLACITAAFTSCGDSTSESSSEATTAPTTTSTSLEVITTEPTSTEAATEAEEEDEGENYDTGDASLDNIRNQDGIGDNELLVVSFGTSFNDSRRLTIGAIENELESAFPDYSVRRGFTANIIIDHVQRRDGFLIDDIDASLQRAVDNDVKNLVVQPTHLMSGIEYDELAGKIANYSDAFDKIAIGKPLLTSDDDFKRVENAIVDWTKEYDDGKTAICFMGHGTEHASNSVYAKMQDMLTADGHTNYFIGTVEATPSVEDVLEKVKAGGYEKVVLEPLMVVAGDHANNDMAGDEEDSWKSIFVNEGYEVECILRGLGENEEIRKLYVEHAQQAIDSIK
ncbi:MAG: sirohydrochlorin cobaltochelatase [Ruminococcus sp.]|nr:sirohydrochlorin cobaltochelatase [Ruminococcus sp.]